MDDLHRNFAGLADQVVIPPLNAEGHLPLFIPPYPSNDATKQSPYKCDIEELRARFSFNEQRVQMFRKLDLFRAELRLFGIEYGFQIFGGTFVSNKPMPRDIDVVTCFRRPTRWTTPEIVSQEIAANPQLFVRAELKKRLQCDANFIDLNLDAGFVAATISRWVLRFSSMPPDPPTRFKGVLFVDLGVEE